MHLYKGVGGSVCPYMWRGAGIPCFSLAIEMYGYNPKTAFPYHTESMKLQKEKNRERPRGDPETVKLQYSREALMSTGFLQFYEVC